MGYVVLVDLFEILFDGLGLDVLISASISVHYIHNVSTDNRVHPLWINCEIIIDIVIL